MLAILRIPGLGPKKAAALYNELKIATLDELKAACESHKVRDLKGFGAKTEEAILAGMNLAQTAGDRMLWASADQFAHDIRKHLESCKSVKQLEVAGSYRRGRETVGDLDILVDSSHPDEVMDRFAEFPELETVVGPRADQDDRSGWSTACKSTCASCPPKASARRCSISPARSSTTSFCAAWPRSAG